MDSLRGFGVPERRIDQLTTMVATRTEPPSWLRSELSGARHGSMDQLDRQLAEPGRPDEHADEPVSCALRHPGSVDVLAVARLRERVRQLDQRYDTAASTSLLADVGQCLGQVSFLRAHADSDRIRRELFAVEAEAATLMGKSVWDASQRRDHTTARTYLKQAITAARQVHAPNTEALALLRMSFVALYGEKSPRSGLDLAMLTAATARHSSQVLAGLGVLHAAEAHAMLGQRPECEQALGAAEQHFEQISVCDTAADSLLPTQHGRLAGSCYLFLGNAEHAQTILERTAVELRGRSKSRAIVFGNLALACIRQQKLDEAAGALHSAIDDVEQTWSGGGLNVVFSAGQELRPWRHVADVQDVYDRLLALMAAA
ncbi:transcriptional regulator [Haloechinothrix sp. LS1_15]|nr:transcriptional regulator [Haloechinothrix sp. LS1_15]